MPHAIFELEQIESLPLWANVLIASRLIRRAILRLPADVPSATASKYLAACDALDRSATSGLVAPPDRQLLDRVDQLQPIPSTIALATALHYAIDSAVAAEASLDFGAADGACRSSARQAFAWAAEAEGMTALQSRIYLATDLDLLRFACGEARIGTYDGLTSAVTLRLVPISPPSAAELPGARA